MFLSRMWSWVKTTYDLSHNFKATIGSLKRNLFKIVILALVGWGALLLEEYYPYELGETIAPLLRSFGITFLGLSAGFLAQCLLEPHVSSQQLFRQVLERNLAAGLFYIGRSVLLAMVLLLLATACRADNQSPPERAWPKMPILKEEIKMHWSTLTLRSYLGGQIEQETCSSLKSPKCWNENAQLLTPREQGVGLGQLTRAFSQGRNCSI